MKGALKTHCRSRVFLRRVAAPGNEKQAKQAHCRRGPPGPSVPLHSRSNCSSLKPSAGATSRTVPGLSANGLGLKGESGVRSIPPTQKPPTRSPAHIDRPPRPLTAEDLRLLGAGARAGTRCFVTTFASRSRTPRPPTGLVSPSLMSSTPAASIAAISFMRESTVPRITPALASMRWIVGTDSRAACANAR
jgi:hypothetical protein